MTGNYLIGLRKNTSYIIVVDVLLLCGVGVAMNTVFVILAVVWWVCGCAYSYVCGGNV